MKDKRGKIKVGLIRDDPETASAMEVRRRVFVDEQGVSRALEFDGLDGQADQFLATLDGKVVGTARARAVDGGRAAKIERVAVLAQWRERGIGLRIMEFVEAFLARKGVERAVLNSQEQARGFYEKLGYEAVGEPFEEAGIPHIKMVKVIGGRDEGRGPRGGATER